MSYMIYDPKFQHPIKANSVEWTFQFLSFGRVSKSIKNFKVFAFSFKF